LVHISVARYYHAYLSRKYRLCRLLAARTLPLARSPFATGVEPCVLTRVIGSGKLKAIEDAPGSYVKVKSWT